MDEAAQEKRIEEFVSITESSPSEARGLLEASNWDLEASVELFYKDFDTNEGGSTESSGLVGDRTYSHNAATASTPPVASRNSPRPHAPISNRRFATLADLTHSASEAESSPAHSDDDEPDNFFTGGEKSGLAVQNPGAGGGLAAVGGRLVNEIFRQAQQGHRGEEDDDEEGSGFAVQKNGKAPKRKPFRGTGFTLGSDEVESVPVPDPTAEDSAGQPTADVQQKVVRHLTFWRNGFSVEDGPLYRYDDPNNVQHLQAIQSGRAPLSLLNVQNGQSVDVHVARKMDEDYSAPKPRLGGYSGHGHRLGSPVPGEVTQHTSPAPILSGSTTPTTSSDPASSEGEGDSLVQIRLADGRRLRHRFDSSGPVQQLYDFVLSQAQTAQDFVLQTTFPSKDLEDKSLNLKEAGVVNAVVVQRIIK